MARKIFRSLSVNRADREAYRVFAFPIFSQNLLKKYLAGRKSDSTLMRTKLSRTANA